MKRIIAVSLVLLYVMLPFCAAFAQNEDDAGLPPLTAKQAVFTSENPDSTDAPSVTAEDAGLSSEIAGDEASSEAGAQEVDSEMDVGMDY